jgi:nucleotide-binding universal stress UspA family protein
MKILLATDGSEYSKGAARFLRCLSLSAEDEITIFHALYWIPFLYDRESYYGTLKEIKKDLAPRIIDSVSEILKPVNAKISTAIVDGPPEECIIDAAVDPGMDMIVMGARGISGFETLLIGSVTRKVAIMSPKPVLVTKLPVSENPEELKILFATDGSDYSMATAEFLSKIPFHDNTKLTIANVMPLDFMDIPATIVPEVIERTIEIADRIRSMRFSASERIVDQAREYLIKRFKNIEVVSVGGHPSAEILKAAKRLEPDLIAVGCRGLRGIRGMMGSVSRNILSHSRCSVLIGKTCKD